MFSDALDREAAWLSIPGTDGLPNLNLFFDNIQARWNRTPIAKSRQLWVLRAPGQSVAVTRTTNAHTMLTTNFWLRIVWPVQDSTGNAENDQLALDQAIDATLARVQGLSPAGHSPGDHTHGGRFLSVAEDPLRLLVDYANPEEGVLYGKYTASIRYSADDFETVN